MFFALDKNNKKISIDNADNNELYFCQICNQRLKLVSEHQRRGQKVREHFSHIGKSQDVNRSYIPCTDRWNYCMSEWHKNWQKRFPEENQECVVSNGDGKHIADVLIHDTIIEFQHSNISIQEFRERNNFYNDCGYKVIWIFDVIEEYALRKLYQVKNPKQNTNKYYWNFPKKMFRQLEYSNEKATIIFQFLPENNNYFELEKLVKGYNEFTEFYTKKEYSIDEFVNLIKNKKFWNNENVKKTSQEQIDQVKDGKTVFELWKNDYSKMVVENLLDEKEMIIYGDRGKITVKNGKVIGKYSNRDISGRYKYSDSYYVVWNAESSIWKLKHFWERDDIEYQVQKVDDTISKYNGCDSLTNIVIQNKKNNIIVHCLYNDKTYVLNFVDNTRYNAFQIDLSSGEILSQGSEIYFVYPFRNKKIWKIVQLEDDT